MQECFICHTTCKTCNAIVFFSDSFENSVMGMLCIEIRVFHKILLEWLKDATVSAASKPNRCSFSSVCLLTGGLCTNILHRGMDFIFYLIPLQSTSSQSYLCRCLLSKIYLFDGCDFEPQCTPLRPHSKGCACSRYNQMPQVRRSQETCSSSYTYEKSKHDALAACNVEHAA